MTLTTLPPQHKIHHQLPSGFGYADPTQAAEFERTGGSVHGASKVALIQSERGPELAIRMRPPRTLDDVRSPDLSAESVEEYIDDYSEGWRDAQAGRQWDHEVSDAYDEGFMDRSAGRIKWHGAYCANPDECGA